MNQAQTNVGNCLDVQSFINQQPLSRYQWRVVLLCFLIVFLDGLDTAAMGFIAPALSQEWGIDRASLGPVMSAALIGMVFGALGSGPLADRFGRKACWWARCWCSVASAWPRPTAPTSTSCWCCA
jgi:AAHS family 4-hydroxybenzoate transporter-like MFS transporter